MTLADRPPYEATTDEDEAWWSGTMDIMETKRRNGECIYPTCPDKRIGASLVCENRPCLLWLANVVPPAYLIALQQWEAAEWERRTLRFEKQPTTPWFSGTLLTVMVAFFGGIAAKMGGLVFWTRQ